MTANQNKAQNLAPPPAQTAQNSSPEALSDELPFDLPQANPPAQKPTQAPPAKPTQHTKPSISQRAIQARAAPDAPKANDYLDGLNVQQRLAVETLNGPLLVLAGAGTGKTRVLTTRIAHIINSRLAYPSQILAVTFTNKAAHEMRERVETLLGGDVEGMPWLGTFHSIGVKILRRHAELVGLKSSFTILDTDDQIRLLKQVLEVKHIDKERWPARQLAALIDDWKNRGLTPGKVPAGEAASFANGKGRELYLAYQSRLKDLNAADFGDLLLECLTLFSKHPDILKDYHRRFQFILVDEYQDTNVAQYLWLRLLAQPAPGEGPPNICCVGDDDQSIYGWRGAQVDNILRFETEFKGSNVIRLERNYRSTGHILGAAAALIANNSSRLGKTLFTDGELGQKVSLTSHWDDEEEARTIISQIESAQTDNASLNEIAILVRASSQMRVLEDRLITTGIPYRVIGGPRFYERAEIKDAIAYLGVTANPSNDLRFERIANVPKRGIGDTSLKRVREFARARHIPIFDAAREIISTDVITKRARKSLSDLIASFDRWRAQIDGLRHTELAELILDESGYTQMWQNDKSPQAASRLDNLKELIRFMHDFETLEGFLEHVALVMAADQKSDGDRVSLMTLHAAKGLEFNTVFLPGFEEGLFPHQRSLDESGIKGLEEERRLAYVGLTRARLHASISFAQNRRTRGLYQSAIPSRFIDELPEQHIEILETASAGHIGGYQDFSKQYSRPGFNQASSPKSRFENQGDPYDADYQTPGWNRAKRHASENRARANNTAQNLPPAGTWKGRQQGSSKAGPKTIEGKAVAVSTPHTSDYKCGERIFHQKFGYGLINEIDGDKLTIEFEKAGKKRVLDSFIERP